MSRKGLKPWEAKWRVVCRLGSGGQGRTSVVRRADEPDDERRYVLKVLHRQDDLERRKRMYREMASLKTLEHTGIPRLVDSNAEKFADLGEHLYIVMEYIQGPTLEDFARSELPPFQVAQAIVLGICEILEYAHEREVRHRDIKPSNVILRDGNPSNPALIDFGLSFNEQPDASEGSLTEPGQQLGNRFLALPELQVSHSAKRDARSDIAQAAGLLYYLLTGLQPCTLMDHEGRKPHEREAARARLAQLPSDVHARLASVFDMAFEPHIDRRIQSARSLRVLVAPEAGLAPTMADRIRAVNQTIRSREDVSGREHAVLLFAAADEHTRAAFEAVKDLLGDGWGTVQTGFGTDLPSLTWRNTVGFFPLAYPEQELLVNVIARMDGAEVVVTALSEVRPLSEILRAPIAGPKDWVALRENLQAYCVESLGALHRTQG